MQRLTIIILVLLAASSTHAAPLPFERTEQREPCADHDPLKKPLFGDLHVHSSYSFDSFVSNQRNDPWKAYEYAKGAPIMLPDSQGEQTVRAQIQRPLDFTAVTDHSEFLGQINICTQDSGKLGYWWPHCMMTRANTYSMQLLAAGWWAQIGVASDAKERSKSFACTLSDCDAGDIETWQNIQRAAEEHYDRSSDCSFTTFVGYEYTDAPNYRNLHRNVIFRNEHVTERAISTYETGVYNFPELWVQLREQCTENGSGCDVISIPHNPNLSGGLMFRDPETQQELDDRLAFEPVIELVQHKGASECRFDRLAGRGVMTEDELCDFEQIDSDNLAMLGSVAGEKQTDRAAAVAIDAFAPRNMTRNVLKDGLAYKQKNGENPFQMGFIGSTDTHSATPGGAEEDNYAGHLGQRDVEYRNVQDHFYSNPGGHAVVWAEENSRDAIFSAIKRKETYATSGTRPTVRFFGGWNYDAQLCNSADLVRTGYDEGVPMGGNLPAATGDAPSFLVTAMKDPGMPAAPGTDLQRVQIIKGWVDIDGKTHEQVFDVAGDANNGATVNPKTCAPVGKGFSNLCAVWKDDNFDPAQESFYYVRVVENPTCRWSTLQCKAAGVDPFAENCDEQAVEATAKAKESVDAWGDDVYGKCCLDRAEQPFYSPTIQERAWTSPIWYRTERANN